MLLRGVKQKLFSLIHKLANAPALKKKTASLPPGNSIRLEDELFLFGAFQTYVQGCFLLLVPGFPGVHWFKKITQVGLNNRLHIRPDFGAFYRLSLQGMVETTFGSAQGVCFFGWDGVLGGASESFLGGGQHFLGFVQGSFFTDSTMANHHYATIRENMFGFFPNTQQANLSFEGTRDRCFRKRKPFINW